MPGRTTQFVARHVHDLVERQRLDSLGDSELLARFIAARDEAAFAALLRRHGPMVLGTCRRILRHAQDAEDACQATFLILARKGDGVRGHACLAGWLHRVAARVALRHRKDAARRAAQTLPAELPSRPPAADAVARQEIAATFDAEVGRLPKRFRLPLILCYLQGLTRNEAARRLGWTDGALRGRVERGRKLLQSRFTRKGLTLPAALAPIVVEEAVPAVSSAGVPASPAVARLADSVLRSMAAARIKMAAWASAAVLLVGTMAGVGVFFPVAAQVKPADAPAVPPASTPPPVSLADAEKNLDTFILRVSLAPKGEGKFDPKFSLYHVLLYVPNLRLEPPANGPDGKPIEAHARITKDQAKKIVQALGKFNFFADDATLNDQFKSKLDLIYARNWPHAGITVRYQNGEDAACRELMLAWLPQMLPPLDAIRGCVGGDAAKALDRLLAQLAEDRKKWDSSIDADWKKLQGNWVIDPKDSNLDGLPSRYMSKCTIDGNAIAFKPKVQVDPLLDLDTIRGTLDELRQEKDLRTLTIVGKRDTVAKVESGTWKLAYRVTDTTLTLLLPADGKTIPADGKPQRDKGDREFVFKRAPKGRVSAWGQASNGVSARIRTSKLQYARGESPVFDLDVRDTTPAIADKPWHWKGLRVGALSEVEVDGVWYQAPKTNFTSAVLDKLAHGQTVASWASVSLVEDYWIVKGSDIKLKLAAGMHTIRVKVHLTPSDSNKATADAVSGPLEIEILPIKTKAPPPANESNWGEPSHGVRTRIRTAQARFPSVADVQIAVDARSERPAGQPCYAGQSAQLACVEVDGRWYVPRYTTFQYIVPIELAGGTEVRPWTTIDLGRGWVLETTRDQKSPQALDLKPGKHTIRVRFPFSTDPAKPADCRPVSGPLEIEITPSAPKPAPDEWEAKPAQSPPGKN